MGHLDPISECLGLSPDAFSASMHHMHHERQMMALVVGSVPPVGKPRLYSQFLASTWTSPGCYGLLKKSEPGDGRSSYVSVFLWLSNQ